MESPAISLSRRSVSLPEFDVRSFTDDHAGFPEEASRTCAARGAVTGILLGVTLWGAILVLAGVVKL